MMMMIKSAGIGPGGISSPYTGKKSEQTAAVSDNRSNAVKLDKISVPGRKLDTIEISPRPVNNGPTLTQTRDKIVSDLSKDKDVSFLQTLKEQISTNQYKIDPKELAKIMLTGEKE